MGGPQLLELDPLDSLAVTDSVNGDAAAYQRFANLDTWLSNLGTQRAEVERVGACLLIAAPPEQLIEQKVLLQLREQAPEIAAVVVSKRASVSDAVAVIKQGAFDVITLPCDPTKLAQAVEAATGESRERSTRRSHKEALRARIGTLSAPEMDVLKALLSGFANKQIAQQFSIGLRTVELRRSRIMKKMQAGNLAHLVRLIYEAEVPELLPV